jgi:hypothetical protein
VALRFLRHRRLKQVEPYARFPSGDSRDLAEVPFTPEQLTKRYGLRFAEDADDFDTFRLAAIDLTDGAQAWFMRYRGEQGPGTAVLIDHDADPTLMMDLLENALGLPKSAFRWISPDVEMRDSHHTANVAHA